MLLSVDAFHQETIPKEIVYDFAKSICDAGIENIKLQPAWVVNKDYNVHYNSATYDILAFFDALKLETSEGNNIFLSGNAKQYLSQYYDAPKLNLADKCGTMPYTSPLGFIEISSISINPNGDVMLCSFAIGNIYTEDIAGIIARYNPYNNNFTRAILDGGISELLEYAENMNVHIDTSKYYSTCDVCRNVMKQVVY